MPGKSAASPSSLKSKSPVIANTSRPVSNPVNASSKLSVQSRRRPSTSLQNSKSNQRKPSQKKCIPKPKPLQNRFPSLPFQVADDIIQLVGPSTLTTEHYHILRELGSGWSCVIDNVYLPVFHKAASFWSPNIEDKVPEGALTRSYGKFFKLSQPIDFKLLKSLSKKPEMGFPAKELKIWCDSAPVQLLKSVAPSLKQISKQIWSFTFVVGATLESVRLLFGALAQMTNLEDLRVICIKKEMEMMQKEIKIYENIRKPVPYPHLSFQANSKPNLACLSVSGTTSSCVLDDLFQCYGKQKSLESLELSGHFVKASQVLDPKTSSDFFPSLEKLKISAGDNHTLSTLSNKFWPLSSVSINWNWMSSDSQPKYATLSKIFEWLSEYEDTLTELYLYVGCPTTDERSPRYDYESFFDGDFPNVRKLGLPYMLAIWDNWIIRNYFWNIRQLELHDWRFSRRNISGEQGRINMATVDVSDIRFRIGGLWRLRRLQNISVWSGKTEETQIVKTNRFW